MKHTHALRRALTIGAFGALVFATTLAAPARAFSHVVQPGESLATLATRVYGDAKLEGVLAAANGLDAQGGVAPVPGMRLEVPAPSYYRAQKGETWPVLAARFLGADARSDVLARANDTVPWVPPDKGEEIVVPYVLAVVAGEADRMDTLAKRFLGDPNRAWELDAYNGRKGIALARGELVLVPLTRLTLTEEGKAEARAATMSATSGGLRSPNEAAAQDSAREDDGAFSAQRRAELEGREMPALLRAGRYVEVVIRATRALAGGVIGSVGQGGRGEPGILAPKQAAPLEHALVVALVALGANEEAARACTRFRALDPAARLDTQDTPPKVRAACLPR